MNSQAVGLELNLYLPVVDNQSDYLDYTDYADDYSGLEDTSIEAMDDEAMTLNHGPGAGHDTYAYSHYPPATYSGTLAVGSGQIDAAVEDGYETGEVETGAIDEDDSMSDITSGPLFANVPATPATSYPHHSGIPPTSSHHYAPEIVYSVNPLTGPAALNTSNGMVADSEWVPYATVPFHVDTGDTDGLMLGTLPPQNPSLFRFLELWSGPMSTYRPGTPWYPCVMALAKSGLRRVSYRDLRGDAGDMQGINWVDLQVERRLARNHRYQTYKNFVNLLDSDDSRPGDPIAPLPNSESYFRFHDMHVRGRNIRLNHFQLRHVLASSTRSRSFYPEAGGIRQINPLSGKDETFLDLQEMENGGVVSTLAATNRVLLGATFNGEYCIKNLESSEPGHHTGKITEDNSGITTHVQVYSDRLSGSPTAAFASNDRVFRTMDMTTEQFLLQTAYNFPVNCSALSPDKRLRLMVGDHRNAVVANAETGEIVRELTGHQDFGFACDWADDGWTVATGSQDMTVRVWDARRWCNSRGEGTPVAVLRSEMAGVRNLKFSPAGGGARVLVAAEEADFVSIVDGLSFERKQTLDMFGEIGGVDFSDGGAELQVLCCDWARGGLMRFERCNWRTGVPGEMGSDWVEEGESSRWAKREARTVEMEPF